jgi:hypothetical protein
MGTMRRERYAELHRDFMILHSLYKSTRDSREQRSILKLMGTLTEQSQILVRQLPFEAWKQAQERLLHTEVRDGRLARRVAPPAPLFQPRPVFHAQYYQPVL